MKKGVSLPIDLTYIIIFFILISVVIIGILVVTSKDLIESIKSGKIYDKFEEMLRRIIGR